MQSNWFRTIVIYAAIVIAAINFYPTIVWQMKSPEEQAQVIEQIRADQLKARAEQYGAFQRLVMDAKHWWMGDPDRQITLGLDLQGGLQMVVGFDMTEEARERGLTESDVQDIVLQNIRNRISELDVQEPVIQRQATDQVLVQLPGVKDLQRARELIKRTAHLGFHIVSGREETEQALIRVDRAFDNELIPFLEPPEFPGGPYQVPEENVEHVETIFERAAEQPGLLPEGKEFAFSTAPQPWETRGYEIFLIEAEESLSGEGLKSAVARPNPQSPGQWVILFEFNAEAAQQFGTLTENNIGRELGIVLDGNVVSAPTIRGRISSSGEIEGSFTADTAKDLAIALNSGSMPVTVEEEYTGIVGPTLGQESVERGVYSAVVGMILVMLFMVFYYRVAGVIADIGQLVNALLLLGAFAYFNVTLTLPGIAGLILTIGMAVDANVLIFERIREELRQGKSVANSIAAGYEKAASAILDSNITTLIAAIVLLQFGTGPVQGFAIALSIGVCTSVFVALVVTRAMYDFLLNRKLLSTIGMMSFLKAETHIKFMNKQRIAFVLSAIALAIGIGAFAFRTASGEMFGVEFTEGTSMQVRIDTAETVSVGEVRSALAGVGFDTASVQEYTTEDASVTNVFTLRISQPEGEQGGEEWVTERVQQALATLAGEGADPAEAVELQSVTTVGPSVGAQLQRDAVLAIAYALIFIIFYLWFRFEWTYAVGSVLALVHDVIIVVGLFALFGREISIAVIAALLTIIGYSLNDTIVVFDRVREDLKIYRARNYTFLDILDISINETLSRTILTGLTTFFVVFVLYLFGGAAINDFAFALIAGVIVGTYSSIYIASPAVYMLQHRRGRAAVSDKDKKKKGRESKRRDATAS